MAAVDGRPSETPDGVDGEPHPGTARRFGADALAVFRCCAHAPLPFDVIAAARAGPLLGAARGGRIDAA